MSSRCGIQRHESPLPLLLVDAGNSRTKFGWFDAAPVPPGRLAVCRQAWAVDDSQSAPWSSIAAALPDGPPAQTVLTGSNPRRVAELQANLPSDWPAPTPLPHRSRFPLSIDVDFPEKVGIDRLLNAIAANQVRATNQPSIVISSGTATTVDYVSPDGRFCGGAILPGFEMSAKALHSYTALLPLIELDVVLGRPPIPVGRNTESALRSGLYWGHIGAVRELLTRLTEQALLDTPGITPLVLLTGGAAPLLQPYLPTHLQLEPHLPLQGLATLITSGSTSDASR